MSDGDGTPGHFEEIYQAGPAPWDIGRPQPALVAAVQRGEVEGRILDVGCGTGENALFLAEEGHDVVGVDLSRHALRLADKKAETRRVALPFHLMDALALEPGPLGGRFDTVVDSGVFHVFSDEERGRYVRALGRVLRPKGTYHMFVFSDAEPTDWGGPRRISEDDIHMSFREGWDILDIRPVRFETNLDISGHAWHARIRKT